MVNRPENVKIVMLKGEPTPPTDEQVVEGLSEILPDVGEELITPWMNTNGARVIDDWLDEHPEATTTVQDHSLTFQKLVNGTLGYVTPEMFGAVGDGVVDDTTAWQNAVNFGIPVKATKKSYKCGQINVTKSIEIDCNGADFICTGTRLFYCTGEVVTTLENEADHTANQVNYAISDAEYANYTGFAMIKGTNNFEKSREYYRGGFACEFKNGILTTTYPIDVNEVNIEIINPITVHISNVGNINHQSVSNSNNSIEILYGFACTIENCTMPDTNGYTVINFNCCLNCIINNCNIQQSFGSSGTNSYLVGINNSSFCVVRNCYMFNKYWHCISTGGIYLCFHNIIENCKVYSDTIQAIEDHENALNTIVRNCVATSIYLAGMGVVKNCDIISNNTSGKDCRLVFFATSNVRNAVYTANNVRFYAGANANDIYVGVFIGGSPYTTGETFYIRDMHLKNIKLFGTDYGRFGFSTSNNGNFVIYDVTLDDSNLNPYGVHSSVTNIDISNWKLYLRNFNTRRLGINQFPIVYGNDYLFNDIYLNNVNLRGFSGSFKNIYFSNLFIEQTIASLNVENELFGTGLHSYFTATALLGAKYLKITDMKKGNYEYWLNISHGNNGKAYYQRYVGGVLSTFEITA